MGHEHDSLSPMVDSVLDRRDSTDDTLRVGDLLVRIQGNVEIDLVSSISAPRVGDKNRMPAHTRMRTRLPLRSTSSMESLFARDMLLREMRWLRLLARELEADGKRWDPWIHAEKMSTR